MRTLSFLSIFVFCQVFGNLLLSGSALAQAPAAPSASQLLLKDYRPVPIYHIPKTAVAKAKYPVFDMHTHDFPVSAKEVDQWVATMDAAGIRTNMILTYATGGAFDSAVMKYAPYKDRFVMWCGFDYADLDKPGWQERAVRELERCHKKGAKGVGELGDKGLGEFYSRTSDSRPLSGMHIDDPRFRPLLEKCAELHMPVSIHVSEDAWMYEAPDSTNDGLMNSATWNVDMHKKGILGHDQLIATLENAVKQNPKTVFIACHLANCCADLAVLGRLLDTYPNLYADIAARYAELAPVPRAARDFMVKYQDRLVYGTDMGTDAAMYHITFRILETNDEHFYDFEHFTYHWPLYGLGLPDAVLEKIYSGNAKKIMRL